MKTNFQALKEIVNYRWLHDKEIRYGIVNEDEARNVIKELSLKEKNLIELRNARDFTVAYIENLINKEDNRTYWDLMSLITYLIDCEILNKGGNV